jgi:2-hydroxychromene-2-carboxylate isomerase
MANTALDIYIDFKSPYAYLAIAPAWTFERDFDVTLNWLPFTLDIASYRGSAEVDDERRVLHEARSAYQWRRVRYTYMDARRHANLRGLTILGTQKIWDSALAGIGMLYAKEQGVLRAYSDIVFERFWRRALDIEDEAVIAAVLREAGAGDAGFAAFAAGPGSAALDTIHARADAAGVFGVPSIVLDGELFWGREQFPMVRLRLNQLGLARTGGEALVDIAYPWRAGGAGVGG